MVELYLDTGDLRMMLEHGPKVSGFTTNPSLMKKAGISNYKDFAQSVLKAVGGKPVSFEVFSDDFAEMEAQAEVISSWGENVYVKIPITNTSGVFSGALIKSLWRKNIKTNVTAIMTKEQISGLSQFLSNRTPTILSVFAGRISDTGVDPMPIVSYAKFRFTRPNIKILWASTREVFNIKQAEKCFCDIITVSPEILGKVRFGQDLNELSLETVRQFSKDSEGIVL